MDVIWPLGASHLGLPGEHHSLKLQAHRGRAARPHPCQPEDPLRSPQADHLLRLGAAAHALQHQEVDGFSGAPHLLRRPFIKSIYVAMARTHPGASTASRVRTPGVKSHQSQLKTM